MPQQPHIRCAAFTSLVLILGSYAPQSHAVLTLHAPSDSTSCAPIALSWEGDAAPYTVNVFGFLTNTSCACSTVTMLYDVQTPASLMKLVVGSDQSYTEWYWITYSGTDQGQSAPFRVAMSGASCAGELVAAVPEDFSTTSLLVDTSSTSVVLPPSNGPADSTQAPTAAESKVTSPISSSSTPPSRSVQSIPSSTTDGAPATPDAKSSANASTVSLASTADRSTNGSSAPGPSTGSSGSSRTDVARSTALLASGSSLSGSASLSTHSTSGTISDVLPAPSGSITTSPSPQSHSNRGRVTGAAVGSVLGTLLILVALCVYRWGQRSRGLRLSDIDESDTGGRPVLGSIDPLILAPPQSRSPSGALEEAKGALSGAIAGDPHDEGENTSQVSVTGATVGAALSASESVDTVLHGTHMSLSPSHQPRTAPHPAPAQRPRKNGAVLGLGGAPRLPVSSSHESEAPNTRPTDTPPAPVPTSSLAAESTPEHVDIEQTSSPPQVHRGWPVQEQDGGVRLAGGPRGIEDDWAPVSEPEFSTLPPPYSTY